MIVFLKRLASSVPTPATDKVTVFVEDSTGEPSYKDDAGTVTSLKGGPGEGVPAGGTAGQVLRKIDGTDYNTEWATPAAVAPDVVNTPSNSAGTVTLDFDGKSRYIGSITLAANVTTLAFSNLPGAGNFAEYELHITEDGTGGHTFAIPASHKALGGSDTAIATGANAVTVLTASTVDNGTTWRYAMQESA